MPRKIVHREVKRIQDAKVIQPAMRGWEARVLILPKMRKTPRV